MRLYTTKQHDMLDMICFQAYGYHTGTVEAVLEANRDLSGMSVLLPAGLTIVLPELPAAATLTPAVMRLWD